MAMTMYEFKVLSDEERMDVLYADGVYIGKRKENNLTLVLYQLHTFYVEIMYRKYRCYIHSMRGSENTEILEPYLDQIDVGITVTWNS
jgi:hypothetical protein